MLIGRDEETRKLKETLVGDASEFVAVYGRRRIGKTYLIRESFDNRFAFYHTGIAGIDRKDQIDRFVRSLRQYGFAVRRKPADWFAAFDLLEDGLSRSSGGKKVVFIDELPWMETPKSNFVSALEAFWNGWASARNDIVLVVCGSATSWMTDKIVNARGGLHNRLTWRIRLEPFTLAECERFAQAKGIVATRRQLLEYFMVMGEFPITGTISARTEARRRTSTRCSSRQVATCGTSTGTCTRRFSRSPGVILPLSRPLRLKKPE